MKKSQKIKNEARARRQRRVRAKVSGTATCPRLSIYRSLNHVYAQLIDDQNGKTIVSARDSEVKDVKTKMEKATAVGKLIAEKAATKKIEKAVFDRGMFKYHGRVKAVADGAREAGLTI
ncbi:50S ribosomal protein L18 [Candidatus Falkowbacteria bacterium]|uniref:Large ribosomal subunit protein uL18 n=1 Tax=Candidatus Buchananbacteria bacterium CG10_big_fil_rev_8_21_14_0_10_33_19 TaxID=1974525 RepID=A0A2H0W520_9BACT|nr:50S ribosomal protein L18 [Candidatus Falkowbacteria bacterium]PIS05740.1 MAG: 50S ribosomal protein L18 [Candidatus Buchananbacteria bacterium CG10_big_fil_rev_8_21_14_0_10_33_19]